MSGQNWENVRDGHKYCVQPSRDSFEANARGLGGFGDRPGDVAQGILEVFCPLPYLGQQIQHTHMGFKVLRRGLEHFLCP